jgi:hypothetical protein
MRIRISRPVALSLLLVFPALAQPALAAPRDDVKSGSLRCDGIADDRAWLDCYYGAAQPMRARLGLPPAPNSQQALVPPPQPGSQGAPPPQGAPPSQGAPPPLGAPRPAAAFQLNNTDRSGQPGFFGRLFTHSLEKAEPPARMKSYSFDKAGYFTVTLANGEVWKQSTVDAVQAKWRNPPGSYVATIQPGSKMDINGHETYQVERIR